MIDAAGKLGGEDADRLDPQLAVLAHQLLKVPFGSFAVAHHQGGKLGKGPAEVGIAVLGIAESLALAVGELTCGGEAAVGHEIRRRGKAPDATDLRRQDGRYYPKSRRKPSRKLFRNEFSNKNSVKLTDFFVDFNSVRMI